MIPFIFSFLISYFNIQQPNPQVIGVIEYDYRGTPRQCEILHKSALYLYENGSLFIYGEGKIEMLDCENGVDMVLRDKYGNQFYKDYDRDSLYIREIIISQAYITSEPLLNFEWKLENETKLIGDYLAKKATTNFRGRSYTAWYSEDISVSEPTMEI